MKCIKCKKLMIISKGRSTYKTYPVCVSCRVTPYGSVSRVKGNTAGFDYKEHHKRTQESSLTRVSSTNKVFTSLDDFINEVTDK